MNIKKNWLHLYMKGLCVTSREEKESRVEKEENDE